MKVYLAGPDVFLPDALARGAALKAVCAEHGLAGVFPLDPLDSEPPEWLALPEWRRIALRNEAHIAGAAALIANLTPFRGPSADPGTVFELGFARALGLPVFGWTADARPFAERTLAWIGGAVQPESGERRDGAGMAVESFGCIDNLMIDGAIAASGGVIATKRADGAPLEAFRACVIRAARRLA